MSIAIGLHVVDMLKRNEEVNRMIGYIDEQGETQLRLYPIVAPEGAERPFIIYQNEGVVSEYTKDGAAGDTVVVHCRCVAEDYFEAVVLAEQVRASMEGKAMRHDGLFAVKDCNLVGSDEAWVPEVDAYEVDVKLEFATEGE